MSSVKATGFSTHLEAPIVTCNAVVIGEEPDNAIDIKKSEPPDSTARRTIYGVSNLPSKDEAVRKLLRKLGEPITLFGEGPYERRERLRHRLEGAEKVPVTVADSASLPVSESAPLPKELFFTEAIPQLIEHRKNIIKSSIQLSMQRIKWERQLRQDTTRLQFEKIQMTYLSHFQNSCRWIGSQVVDGRPLTCGSFAPCGTNCIAITSSSGLVAVYAVSENPKLLQTFQGHSERASCITWRPTQTLEAFTVSEGLKESLHGAQEKSIGLMNSEIAETVDSEIYQVPEGVALLSGAADGQLALWKMNQKSPVALLQKHEDRVHQVDVHPMGDLFASTSLDETWRLSDFHTLQELLVQEGHADGVYAAKFHPDGGLIATGDMGGVVRVWDLRTGRTITTFQGHTDTILSTQFDPLFAHRLATSSKDHTVRVWDLRVNACIETLLAHNKPITQCIFEPYYGRYLLTASHDGFMKVWSSLDFSCIKSLPCPEACLSSAHISPDAEWIAAVSFDRTWKLWNHTKAFDGPIVEPFEAF